MAQRFVDFAGIVAGDFGVYRKRATGIQRYANPEYTLAEGDTRGHLRLIGTKECPGTQLDLIHVRFGTITAGNPSDHGEEKCCCEECPCYPCNEIYEHSPGGAVLENNMLINAWFLDPPLHLKQIGPDNATNTHCNRQNDRFLQDGIACPKIEYHAKPQVEDLVYRYSSRGPGVDPHGETQRSLNLRGKGGFTCPQAVDACKELDDGNCGGTGIGDIDPNTGESEFIEPRECCQTPICRYDLRAEHLQGQGFGVPTNEQPGVAIHSRCWSLFDHLRVWFWIMPYWDHPINPPTQGNDPYDGDITYPGADPGCKGGMYTTTSAGIGIPGPNDLWVEGVLSDGTLSFAGPAGNLNNAMIKTTGSWGFWYFNPSAQGNIFGGSMDKIQPAIYGSTNFITPGQDPNNNLPCLKPRQWQFYHMDVFYEWSEGKDPNNITTRVIMTVHVGDFGVDNNTPTLHKWDTVGGVPGGGRIVSAEVGDAAGRPLGPGDLRLGYNAAYGDKGYLGYGGHKFLGHGYTFGYSPIRETDHGLGFPTRAPGQNFGQEMCYNGWLIDNIGFSKSSMYQAANDQYTHLTAEELWNDGKGVPCVGDNFDNCSDEQNIVIPERVKQAPNGGMELPGFNVDLPIIPSDNLDDDANQGDGLEETERAPCIEAGENCPNQLGFEFIYGRLVSDGTTAQAFTGAENNWQQKIAFPVGKEKIKVRISHFHDTETSTLALASITGFDQRGLPSSASVRVNLATWYQTNDYFREYIVTHELGHALGISGQVWGVTRTTIPATILPATSAAHNQLTGLNRQHIPLSHSDSRWSKASSNNMGHWMLECKCMGGDKYYGLYKPDHLSELMVPSISHGGYSISRQSCAFLVELGYCCNVCDEEKAVDAENCCENSFQLDGGCDTSLWTDPCVNCGFGKSMTETERYEFMKSIEEKPLGFCGGDTGGLVYEK